MKDHITLPDKIAKGIKEKQRSRVDLWRPINEYKCINHLVIDNLLAVSSESPEDSKQCYFFFIKNPLCRSKED